MCTYARIVRTRFNAKSIKRKREISDRSVHYIKKFERDRTEPFIDQTIMRKRLERGINYTQ